MRNTGGRGSTAQLTFKLCTQDPPYVTVALGGVRIVYGNSTTEEFILLVKARDLEQRKADGLPDPTDRWTAFFEQWLSTSCTGDTTTNKPQITAATFDAP